ncbi:MAG: hypothetical protein WBC51_14305 [Vicinamibacterales bacterium]
MAQQIAHLRKRNVLLDEPRGILVPHVMPAQVDAPEPGATLGGERRPVVRLPSRLHAVCLQHSRNPRGPEAADRLARLVAEDEGVIRLLLVVCVELQPFEDRPEPRGRNRYETGASALRRFAAQRDQATREVDVLEADREHLALTHAGIERGNDHRPEEGRSDSQELCLLGL